MAGRILALVVLGAIVGFAVGSAFILVVTSFNPNYLYAGRAIDVGGGIYVWGGTVALLGALIGMAAGVAFTPDPDTAVISGASGH